MGAFRHALAGALAAKTAEPEARVAIFDKYASSLAHLEDFELREVYEVRAGRTR